MHYDQDMFDDAFPIISTPDLERALGFYRDLLGGVVEYEFPADGEPGYVSLRIGTAHLVSGGCRISPSARPASASRSGCTPRVATRQSTGCVPVEPL